MLWYVYGGRFVSQRKCFDSEVGDQEDFDGGRNGEMEEWEAGRVK